MDLNIVHLTAGCTDSSWFPTSQRTETFRRPLLIDLARRGPLEDSGEFRGYEEIMEALADPSRPDYAE